LSECIEQAHGVVLKSAGHNLFIYDFTATVKEKMWLIKATEHMNSVQIFWIHYKTGDK
jgi:hypothetical protein